MTTASHPAQHHVMGLTLHNTAIGIGGVFLLVGVLGFIPGITTNFVYLLLWIYGLVIDMNAAANFVPFNAADNWLHLVLGVGMVGLGLWLGRDAMQKMKGSTP